MLEAIRNSQTLFYFFQFNKLTGDEYVGASENWLFLVVLHAPETQSYVSFSTASFVPLCATDGKSD